jgi:hypothetical protein
VSVSRLFTASLKDLKEKFFTKALLGKLRRFEKMTFSVP